MAYRLKPLKEADEEKLTQLVAERFERKVPFSIFSEGVTEWPAFMMLNLQGQLGTLWKHNQGWALQGDDGMLAGYFRHQERPVARALAALSQNVKTLRTLPKEDRKRLSENGKKLRMKEVARWKKRACQGPYYYINLICIDEKYQGKGAFRALIKPALNRADKLGIPVLLDTFDPENVPIYEHFDFHVVEEMDCGEGATVYAMMRLPKAKK